MHSTIVAALLIGLTGSAGAAELMPDHAHSIALNGVSGVAYYTVVDGSYRMVAVVAAGPESKPVRFTATLLPEQRVAVSVPGRSGEPEAAIEFVRSGDAVLVSPALVALN